LKLIDFDQRQFKDKSLIYLKISWTKIALFWNTSKCLELEIKGIFDVYEETAMIVKYLNRFHKHQHQAI